MVKHVFVLAALAAAAVIPARALAAPSAVVAHYFFDGLEAQDTRAVSPRERMCLELARNFAQIPNERHQEALSQLARVLATD